MPKRVILAGGGHAHLAVLADWARQPIPATERWLVTTSRQLVYSGMLPGWIAGLYQTDELLIDLQVLADAAGARLVLADVTALDADARTLTLATGEVLAFDLLSIATGGENHRGSLAALGRRLVPVRPLSDLMQGWSHFVRETSKAATATVAVVGGGAAGVELALAVQAALIHRFDQPHVALITPRDGFLAGHTHAVRQRVQAELARRNIALHFAEAVGETCGLRLSNGTYVPADCIIAATGSQAPRWLAGSGLARSDQGFVAIGADLRSISHPAVFAAGDIIDRVDRKVARSGVHAVKAGPVLAANLRAACGAAPLIHYRPGERTLYLLSTGDRRAILSWGRCAASGRWVWRWKDWIDRRFMKRYTDQAVIPITKAPAQMIEQSSFLPDSRKDITP